MKAAKGIPLQWLLPSAIVSCLALMLLLVVVQGYRGLEAAMLSAANDSARQLGLALNERAGRLLNPVESTIRLLAHDPLGAEENVQARLSRLPLLVETLNANRVLGAAYVGYATGEFLLVRHLDEQVRREYDAPELAEYMVQSISLNADGELVGQWLFYDVALRLQQARAKPDYQFDPRTRGWYQSATASQNLILTRPYVFFTTQEVGLTMAIHSLAGDAVIGLDASVSELGGEAQDLRLTPGTEIVVIDGSQGVMVYPDAERLIIHEQGEPRLATLDELDIPPLTELMTITEATIEAAAGQPVLFKAAGWEWYGMNLPLSRLSANQARVLISIPADELLSDARAILFRQALWIVLLSSLLVLIGWALGQRLGQPLKALTDQLQALRDYDFSHPPGVRSSIREVRDLNEVIGDMARAIDQFQAITLSLSQEPRLDNMLEAVLARLVNIAGGRSAVVYLYQADGRLQRAASLAGADYPEQLVVEGSLGEQPEHLLDQLIDTRQPHLSLALHDRQEALVGVMLIELHESLPASRLASLKQFVQRLSGSLAVAIETRQLFEGQQLLLEAIIKLLADAIDAKSPYTAGHCERVPQLAQMLLDQAVNCRTGAFAEFQMSDEQRYAFSIAAWLHDCGKITSPEYVVDKATKLETLYNRIHEIRTRFEVLWRDAQIEYWQGLAEGQPEAELMVAMNARHMQLQDDFERVAQANIGGEFMSDAALEALQDIAGQTWWRHFDNRLGLSTEEALRHAAQPQDRLPVQERLLDDRPEHVIPWGERRPPVEATDPNNRWGFAMQLPEHSMNLGELYNLSIRRGTLTAEERFKINDHIVQTLIMLRSLPFPKPLQAVPDIAANHHERLDGRGYPRGLSAEHLGVPDRVLAIADIFEALTAADRPYKTPKPLSEAINILCQMAMDRHVDASLLILFLESGLHREYGRRFLRPEQLDDVDVAACIARLEGIVRPAGPV